MQPGETTTPGGQPPEPAQPDQAPQPSTEAPESGWEFHDEDANTVATSKTPAQRQTVTWTASEYIAHEKGAGWYALLGLAIAASAVAIYLLTGELVSAIVIIIMGIAFGAFAARKPQELDYILDNTALHIGSRPYPYGQFKSFTIVDEGPIHSIVLMPLQRFMPPLSVYFDPQDEDKISEALSSYLPYEDRKQDFVDRMMRKVRF